MTYILDESDWNNRYKTVTFFVNNISEFRIHGSQLDLPGNFEKEFHSIQITGEEFKIDIEMKGDIIVLDKNIEIDFI